MMTNPQPSFADPWQYKGQRLWLITVLALIACFVFAVYDSTGFYVRYMGYCADQPARRECRPLNLVKEERPPDLGLTLDHGKGRWALEIGPRQEEARANETAARLRSLGIEPRVISMSGRGKKVWYQVQVGRFPDRKGGSEAGTQLRGKGVIQDFRLVEYRPIR